MCIFAWSDSLQMELQNQRMCGHPTRMEEGMKKRIRSAEIIQYDAVRSMCRSNYRM
jgi:hypothetical protein